MQFRILITYLCTNIINIIYEHFCWKPSLEYRGSRFKRVFRGLRCCRISKIITDKFTGRSKGFGFVEMPNDEEGQKAIDELNGATVDGRAIVVNKSEPKPEGERKSFNNSRPSGGGYGGGNSRGGDSRGGYNGGGNSRGGGSNDRGGNRGGY